MSDAKRIEGNCLCGAVSIALAAPAAEIEICQCDMCRRWAGSFYGSLPAEDATVSGEDDVAIYRSSEWAERAFCAKCGSNLWYRFLPTDRRSFAAGLFDACVDRPIEKEIFVDEAARWTSLSGNHRKQTGAEVIAEAEVAGFTFD